MLYFLKKAKDEGRTIRQFSCSSYWTGKSSGKVSLLVKLSIVLEIPDKSNLTEEGLTFVYSVLNLPWWEGHCSRRARLLVTLYPLYKAENCLFPLV